MDTLRKHRVICHGRFIAGKLPVFVLLSGFCNFSEELEGGGDIGVKLCPNPSHSDPEIGSV